MILVILMLLLRDDVTIALENDYHPAGSQTITTTTNRNMVAYRNRRETTPYSILCGATITGGTIKLMFIPVNINMRAHRNNIQNYSLLTFSSFPN